MTRTVSSGEIIPLPPAPQIPTVRFGGYQSDIVDGIINDYRNQIGQLTTRLNAAGADADKRVGGRRNTG